MVHGLSKWNGIKLVGTPTRSMPLPPLTVHLSRFSEKAGKAIIAAGGSCLSVYHNRLSLRQEVFPEKFVGREIKSAGPTRRPDIGELNSNLLWCDRGAALSRSGLFQLGSRDKLRKSLGREIADYGATRGHVAMRERGQKHAGMWPKADT